MPETFTPSSPRYPDVAVQLSEQDGNAFAIIGRVRKAISREHGNVAADAFANDAMDTESYDALLQFVMSTVVVS